MRQITGQIDGDLELEEPLQLDGMITGTIHLLSGGTLLLNGMCCGDLVLGDRSEARVSGMVNGSVVNRGGKVEVYGMVLGEVRNESGQTYVDPGAVVQGGRT